MRIEWGLQASHDLEIIADYYGQFDPALPETLIVRIYKAALPLIDNPHIGVSVGHSKKRKWLARKTPFLLIYEVRGDIIFIARVVHSASDWKNLI
jgi:toxin ParE1/3/4